MIAHFTRTLEDLAHAYEIPVHPLNARYADQAEPGRSAHDGNFQGGLKTRADVSAIVSAGWTDGAARLQDMRRDLALDIPAARSRVRRPRWSDQGDELHIERALRGEWENAWRSTRREVTTGSQAIDLICYWGASFDTPVEDLFWSGAAGVVACDILEAAGYRVRLIATSMLTHNRHVGRVDIEIKREDEPLRIDALAGVICHGGIFRTLGFREAMRFPWNVGYGLGAAMKFADAPAGLRPDYETAVVLDQALSRDTAIGEIEKVIAHVQGRGAVEE